MTTDKDKSNTPVASAGGDDVYLVRGLLNESSGLQIASVQYMLLRAVVSALYSGTTTEYYHSWEEMKETAHGV